MIGVRWSACLSLLSKVPNRVRKKKERKSGQERKVLGGSGEKDPVDLFDCNQHWNETRKRGGNNKVVVQHQLKSVEKKDKGGRLLYHWG